jgi:hypothetical protein
MPDVGLVPLKYEKDLLMKPVTPDQNTKPTANPPSLKNRLVGEALVASGRKNNEPSMVKTGERMLQKVATPTKATSTGR